MLFNYKMTSATIGQIPAGKANAGMYYVVAQLKNVANRRGKSTTITVFANDDEDFVTAVRSVFPATGIDPTTNQPWNGTDTTAPATGFDRLAAIKKLESLNGEDYTLFQGGKNFSTPLPGKYVMTYATNLNGHAAGEPVLEKNSSFVKVVSEVNIFVMMYDEAAEQYVEGYTPADRLRSRMNNLIPLEEFIKDPAKKAMVNPRDLGETVIVPLDAESDNADESF